MSTNSRRSIDTETLSHAAPIPVATQVGPLVMSSVISPYDSGTRSVPVDVDEQVANLFVHIQAALREVDFTLDDVVKVTVFTAGDPRVMPALNAEWLRAFPDEASRPSRHSQSMPDAGDGIAVLCDFIAYRVE